MPFGIFLALFTPPFQAADEPQHFFRAYAISEGRLWAQKVHGVGGDLLPRTVAQLPPEVMEDVPFHRDQRVRTSVIRGALGRDLRPEDRLEVEFPGSSVYFPIVYAPQAVGMAVTRLAGGGPLEIMYGGRVGNLLFAVALLFLAIRLMPAHGWTLAAFGLLPTVTFLRSTLSADGLTIAAAVLFLALVMNLAAAGQGGLRWQHLAALAATGVVVALSKQTYGVLVLATFVVPAAVLGGGLRKAGLVFGLGAMMLGASAVWSLSVAELFRMEGSAEGSGLGAHLAYVREHPWEAIRVVSKHLWVRRVSHLHGAIGWFGWVDAPIPRWTMWVLFGAMAVIAAFEPSGAMRSEHRALLVTTFVLGGLAVTGILYLTWTPVGEKTVLGVQGRYFLPLAPLTLVAAAVPRLAALPLAPLLRRGAFVLVATASAATTVTTLFLRYYY